MNEMIFKVLAGQQAGAEVSLGPGTYSVGSGIDDDLQLMDLSVAQHHLEIQIEAGKVSLLAKNGGATSASGLDIQAGHEDWVEVEPLDVISLGTLRFAVGAKNAQWTTVGNALGDAATATAIEEPKLSGGRTPKRAKALSFASREFRQKKFVSGGAIAACLLLGLLGFRLVVLPSNDVHALPAGTYEDLKTGLSQLPFAQDLTLKKEVDGQTYLAGFVETPVERRAIMDIVEQVSLPVHTRVRVLESIRQDIAATIKSRAVDVSFDLDKDGTLKLWGTVLDRETAAQVNNELSNIAGVRLLDSQIKTADDYLTQVQRLAKRALVDDTILFRLDGNTLEVSGVITSQDIDRWSGFLRSYSNQFAAAIPMRSLVKLVQDNGQVVDLQTNIENETEAREFIAENDGGDDQLKTLLAVEAAEKTLIDQPTQSPADRNAPLNSSKNTLQLAASKLTNLKLPVLYAANGVSSGQAKQETTVSDLKKDTQQPNAPTPKAEARREELAGSAKVLLGAWQDANEIESLPTTVKEQFLPLLLEQPEAGKLCIAIPSLTIRQVEQSVVWLDILSSSEELSLKDLTIPVQSMVLQTALNPEGASQCLASAQADVSQSIAARSRFLKAARTNPQFLRFLTRHLGRSKLSVAGANLTAERYIQTSENTRFLVGQSISDSARLLSIGELGILIRQYEGFAVVLYNETTNWVVRAPVALLD
ncbi:FHA domain-containing protein [Polycladidibacter hongkongensis]|uniref:FHA domain-containing protein n=1 Tax=Polycladidibacter hongkongensis TaxID=1647556 RepID=UPI00082B4B52|nr:FHA domain-containing protein [Pseudovibrio hongkongensis]